MSEKNITSLNQIKNWFKTGLKPTQAQFWAWLDSFWHKEEQIPQDKISGLAETLENKAEIQQLQNHCTDLQAHQSLFNQKVDKIDGKTLSSNDFTNELKEKLEHIDLNTKVDKQHGKGLSTNDFTDAYKQQIEQHTEQLQGKVETSDPRLSNARPSSDVPQWAKQPQKPSYAFEELLNKPPLFDGDYNSLTNKPTIPIKEDHFFMFANLWDSSIYQSNWAGIPPTSAETFHGYPIYKATSDWQGWNITYHFTEPLILSFFARSQHPSDKRVRVLLATNSGNVDRYITLTEDFQRYQIRLNGIKPQRNGSYGLSIIKATTEISCIQLEYADIDALPYTPPLSAFQQKKQPIVLPLERHTTPIDGGLHYDGQQLYFTIRGQRKRIQLLD